jgi:hypothetical protein
MLQNLSTPGESVSSSLPWSSGVRKTFSPQGTISHSSSKIRPGMSQQRAATSTAVMFQAHSLTTPHGTEYPHLCSVRHSFAMAFLYYTNVTFVSVDNKLAHHQSARSHDAHGCISAPLGAHVCPAMLRYSSSHLCFRSQTEPTGLARSCGPSGEAYTIAPRYRRSRSCGDRYGTVRFSHRPRNFLSVSGSCRESPLPRDDDQIMLSATRGSQFTQSLMLFVSPSSWKYQFLTRALVSDARRYPLHAAPDALLGIYTTTRTDHSHSKSTRDTICPYRRTGARAQWRTTLPYRCVGCTSRAVQRLGDCRVFPHGGWERAELLRHAT